MRTANTDGAHVEYCRGISNPIGVKVGPAMTPEWLEELLERINPDNRAGRLVIIHRMGSDKVADKLPPIIDVVKRGCHDVLFCVDAMHGNTETTAAGIKTRRFERILSEVEQSFAIHRDAGSHLGGIHFELTGENVTECIGGTSGVEEHELHLDYRSKVDPRLNYQQALEMAMLITTQLRRSSAP
jgi:3-deoxy-7-phosphoheptulonate synthase